MSEIINKFKLHTALDISKLIKKVNNFSKTPIHIQVEEILYKNNIEYNTSGFDGFYQNRTYYLGEININLVINYMNNKVEINIIKIIP